MLPLVVLRIVSHTLFDKCLNHMLVKFEQNHMFCTIQELKAFKQKNGNHFWQRVDTILEDASVTETIFNAKLLT